MGRYNPTPYSPHHAFVALRAFTYASVEYNHGDAFPTVDVPEHRLRQMFDARKIGPKGFGADPPAYLENGRGKADKLAREIAAEESQVEGDSREAQPQSRPARKPAPPQRANAKKPVAAHKPSAAKTVGKSKLKPAPAKRARA